VQLRSVRIDNMNTAKKGKQNYLILKDIINLFQLLCIADLDTRLWISFQDLQFTTTHY